MNQQEQLTAVLKTCDRHALRLTWAMQKMGLWLPINATRFQEFDDDEVAVLEVFSNRFGKLQDAMGAKLFPLTLEIAKEPDEFLGPYNVLHKLRAGPARSLRKQAA